MEPVRILKEALARHCKKFAGPLGCIVVKRDEPSLVERFRKPFPTLAHPAHPISPPGCRRKRWDTVDLTVEQVDSMGASVRAAAHGLGVALVFDPLVESEIAADPATLRTST